MKVHECPRKCFYAAYCSLETYSKCPCIDCVVLMMCKLKATCPLHSRYMDNIVEPDNKRIIYKYLDDPNKTFPNNKKVS